MWDDLIQVTGIWERKSYKVRHKKYWVQVGTSGCQLWSCKSFDPLGCPIWFRWQVIGVSSLHKHIRVFFLMKSIHNMRIDYMQLFCLIVTIDLCDNKNKLGNFPHCYCYNALITLLHTISLLSLFHLINSYLRDCIEIISPSVRV